MNYFITTRREQFITGLQCTAAGFLLALLLAVIGHASFGPVIGEQHNAHKFCQWPRHEGEAMTVIIQEGKIRCYELNR